MTNKLSEEDMLKAKTGQKQGLLQKTVSQVLKAEEKFLKEMKSATPQQMNKKAKNPYC